MNDATNRFRPGGFRGQIIQAITSQPVAFDPDVWRVMEGRDEKLIEEEILHGAQSSQFVYVLPMEGGKPATGISIIGARQLAVHRGGLEIRFLSSTEKNGAMFVTETYAREGVAADVKVQVIEQLRDEPDYYEIRGDIFDIHTGLRKPAIIRENRLERRSRRALKDNPNLPEYFERPHYRRIAQSKLERNLTVMIVPQDVLLEWKEAQLRLGKSETITGSVIDERREAVETYAARKAIPLDRHALEHLTMAQITGLSQAAGEDRGDGFRRSAEALGIVVSRGEPPQDRPATAAPARPQLTQPSPEASAKPVDPEPTTTSTPVFDCCAVDENGEAMMGGDGRSLQFTAPQKFATWLVAQANRTTPDKRLALYEHNADAINDARRDPVASAILSVLLTDNAKDTTVAAAEAAKVEQPAAAEGPSPAMKDAQWVASQFAATNQRWELDKLLGNAAFMSKVAQARTDPAATKVVADAEDAMRARMTKAEEALKARPRTSSNR